MSSHHGILVHLVFSTKYRKFTLADDWRDDLLTYTGGTIKDHKAVLLKSGGIEDHVHLCADEDDASLREKRFQTPEVKL